MGAAGAVRQMPRPKRIHVILSKFFGGTMVFWMLWRAKHDWPDLVGHQLLFEMEDAERAKRLEKEKEKEKEQH